MHNIKALKDKKRDQLLYIHVRHSLSMCSETTRDPELAAFGPLNTQECCEFDDVPMQPWLSMQDNIFEEQYRDSGSSSIETS